ncbi:MAG: hypothetical protein CM15mP129_10570 [Chloroflexota bacterium]|nr:MAG: hypothetical protein CM15mP129_10570 [Chloroflexota bacterium]
MVIGLGMTEPNAGSAVTDLTTKATQDGKGLEFLEVKYLLVEFSRCRYFLNLRKIS